MREYFPCYNSYLTKIAKLSDQEVGRLFRALLTYSATGEAQELTGREAVAFDFIRDDIDRANESYAQKCETNRRNRTSTTVNDRQRPSTNRDDRTQNKDEDKDEDKDETKGEAEEKGETEGKGVTGRARARFTPPTPEDVRGYCLENGYLVDADRFVAYYESNGWKVGRNPMKDWKAAVRTWAHNEYGGSRQQAQTPNEKARAFMEMAKREEAKERGTVGGGTAFDDAFRGLSGQ